MHCEGAFTRPITVSGSQGMPPPMISWNGIENPMLTVETHEEPGGFEFIREICLPESVETIFQLEMVSGFSFL